MQHDDMDMANLPDCTIHACCNDLRIRVLAFHISYGSRMACQREDVGFRSHIPDLKMRRLVSDGRSTGQANGRQAWRTLAVASRPAVTSTSNVGCNDKLYTPDK